jgi:ATP-dependent helicase HrpB
VSLQPLPIDAVLPRLTGSLRQNTSAVVRAPTGSGKTTRVPPALLDSGLAGDRTIIMLEPRRVATRAAARRIAWERGGRVGGEVGYAVRFDQPIGRDTRSKIVTDGVLLRMLHDDPFLEQASIVIFDEFHERGLNADLALAMVRRVQQTVRPDLKIVVMSATLAAEPIAQFLGNCPIIEAEGRLFPVDVSFIPHEDPRPLPEKTAAAVAGVLERITGDVLVFLPGVGEIRRTAERLAGLAARHNLAVMELYGDLPAEQQDAVLSPADRRKVVLATNVAETSITIEGVTAVVDTGVARVLRYEPAAGLDRLVLTKISRSSADQRTGRAGRTQPGLCLRLWTERDHIARPAAEEPEVRRVDVAGPVLQLAAWGEQDAARFPWFESPSAAALEQADALLTRLGAIKDRRVTELGSDMARLPVHPRIARLLVEGHRLGEPARAALAGALLSERDPFLRERPTDPRNRPRLAVHRSRSDILDRVIALENFDRRGSVGSEIGKLNVGAARFILHVRDQLLAILRQDSSHHAPRDVSTGVPPRRPMPHAEREVYDADEVVLRCLFAAFPDRLARRREPGSRGGVLAGGRGVRLAEQSSVMDDDLFVCVDVDADKSESLVRLASAVDREWLDPDRMTTEDEFNFDESAERVVAIRRTSWDGLVLDTVPVALPSERKVAETLAAAAATRLDRVLPPDESFTGFLTRVRCLREWMPQVQLPALDHDQLRALLPDLCQGRRTFAELREAPWVDFLKGQLTHFQLQSLDREAPERLQIPSGSRIALRYEPGRPPVLAVRIQELFGITESPRIAGGRVAVLLHLLAPNMRPQQVTDDLESFWANTYPKIRNELRRRYPKHAWPEDPRSAEPQRRPGRRK